MTKHRFTPGNQAARKPARATLRPFSCRLSRETVAKVREYAKRGDLGLKSQGMVVTRAMHCLELHVMATPTASYTVKGSPSAECAKAIHEMMGLASAAELDELHAMHKETHNPEFNASP